MRLAGIILLAGGILNFCAAVMHLAFSFAPEWSAIFSPGDFHVFNRLPFQALSLGVAILCAIWGFYGLSGAGLIRRLPLLRLGVFLIGAFYISYGLLVIFRLLASVDFLPSSGTMNVPSWLVTVGALTAGLFYLVGLAIGWNQIGTRPAQTNV